ncbi:MAG: NUDIX hydrolase [Gammaproteobacteria bacterium]|nr:NUDIX hydrolase [Gammaproteobacteria bacterium]NIR81855.1 NUDIX hydrolase [Gammaproteobacteria bacterium]NIR88687.1 NUDIX hydrolase [Gammaproteobacteria bacterium]NIU02963.1 NUDIX hydrolase [Gammaproteobacteria bacterium]NIV50484.1 NUDIX domain-containing protein [Gammaproteobacteria bacterium]
MHEHAYPAKPTVAVGAVVFKGENVLLVKRRHPPNQGLWAIPGGAVELGETLQQAAEREILEETGVVIEAGPPVHIFDVIKRDPDDGVRYHYVIADVTARYVRGEPSPRDDALDARWIGAAELDTLAVSATTRELLEKTLGFGRRSVC